MSENGGWRNKVLIWSQDIALIVHLNTPSKGLHLYLKLFGTKYFGQCAISILLSCSIPSQLAGPAFCCHHHKTEDLHLPRWKTTLGKGWQGEGCQSNGNHWSEICQVLEKCKFFYLGQRCWLPYCVWVSRQIKLCVLPGIINGSVMDLYYLRKWTGRQRSFCLLPCKCQI